tara:strand:+ start:25540 stop:27102 length:1563 start_codon:yes stop_codon:yes gene_type:complete
MAELGTLSDEDLLSMIGQQPAPAPQPSPLSQMTNEQLMQSLQQPTQTGQTPLQPLQPVDPSPSQQKDPSLLQRFGEFQLGGARGFLRSAAGVASLAEKAIPDVIFPEAQAKARENIEALRGIPEVGGAGQIGEAVEQVGEFLLPIGAGAKLAKTGIQGVQKLLSKAPKLLQKIGKLSVVGATEAGTAGAVRLAQTAGEDDKDVATTMAIAGLFPLGGAAIKATGGTAKKAATKILQAQIFKGQGKAKLTKLGFKPENLEKFELFGTLSQAYAKAEKLTNKKLAQVQDLLGTSKERVDILDVLVKAEAKLADTPFNQKVLSEIRKIADDNFVLQATDDLSRGASINDANFIRKAAIKKAKFAEGSLDFAAKDTAKAYNTFYAELRDAIAGTSKLPKQVKKLNKEISELIPISNAIEGRIDKKALEGMINFRDSLLAFGAVHNPLFALVLTGAKAAESPAVSAILRRHGKNLESLGSSLANLTRDQTIKTQLARAGAKKVSGEIGEAVSRENRFREDLRRRQ